MYYYIVVQSDKLQSMMLYELIPIHQEDVSSCTLHNELHQCSVFIQAQKVIILVEIY